MEDLPSWAEWAIQILLLGFFVWLLYAVLRPRYAFEIRITQGKPRAVKGKVTAAFLIRVAEVCQEKAIPNGSIGGIQQGRRIRLRFSRHFPPGTQQSLRNEWLSGI